MEQVVFYLSWAAFVGGSFFCIVGGIGLLRFPDFYTRTHASGVTDTLGAGLMIAGMMLQSGLSLNTARLMFILLLLYLTSATSTHALAKAALRNGLQPLLKQKEKSHSRAD